MSPIPKKRRLDDGDDEDDNEEVDDGSTKSGLDGSEPSSEGETGSDSDASSIDTDTEIALAQLPGKSKKTSKRKRRAVSPTPFGRTLTALLETTTSTTQPLALRPSIAKKHNDEKLEMRAKKLLHEERKQKEEKGRVKDVIGGWGGESERALRKVAQRGVVKLFNMIQQVQSTEGQDSSEPERTPRGGKRYFSTLKEPESKKGKGRTDEKVDIAQDDFMQMIRSGGVVLKD